MELRQYQIDIADKAATIVKKYGFVYLAMEVRTGKTFTALQTVKNLGLKKVLFVTKLKAIEGIKKDCQHYPRLDVTFINFESAHKVGKGFDIVIVDEMHSLGAFPKPSLRAKVIKEICKGEPIIGLSGTPSPESWSQLYHQFWVSDFSPYKNYINFYKWAKFYVNIKKKYVFNREINDYSDANIGKIKEDTKHLFLSYTQIDAGFEQRVTEQFMSVPMPIELKKIITTVKRDKVFEGIIADTAVKEMSKVHQLCSGSVIDEDGNYIIFSDFKAQAIRDKFEGQKIAIYYKFKSELTMLLNIFRNECTLKPEEFQNGSKRVFLGQFISAREGIRLDKADCIIFFNIDFSYLSYEQAKNRLISKDREKEAVLWWCFSDCGVEQRIYKQVSNKKDFTLKHYKDV